MKNRILVVICILLCGVLFAEENLWITTEDIPVWKDGVVIKTFPKDTKLILDNIYVLSKSTTTDRDGYSEYVRNVYSSGIIVDGENYYYIEVKNIIPIDTPDLFDESFLSIAHYPSRYLLPSYFVDVLKSGKRATMYKHEYNSEKDIKDIEKMIEAMILDPWVTAIDYWWENPENTGESIISQSALRLKWGEYFFVKRIEKIPNGYKVDVKRERILSYKYSFFPTDRLEYPLFFQFDGDYVDIYVDNLSNKVLSLIYVSPDFYERVQTVISDDVAVDLSNIIWPRRLDGSSDYDDDIIPRQELPQIYRDPLEDMRLVIDETTTLEEVKEALETTSMSLLDNASALTTAIANNANIELIKSLIEIGANVNATTNQGLTALMYATDSLEITKLLIEAGADEFINQKNDNGNTALGHAVLYSQNIGVIKFLVESGADVNSSTPLMSAVENGNIEIVRFLLESGADVNAQNNYGNTPFWSAITSKRSPEIISMLLNAGASFYIWNELGWDVFEIARENHHVDDYPYYASEIVAGLIEMGWESVGKIIWQERGKNYHTTDNLRLRAEDGVSGNPLFTLQKDTPVKILSIGNIEKIDDIIAYWVEVEVTEDTIDTAGTEVKKGAVGWCFGGYLTNENIVK